MTMKLEAAISDKRQFEEEPPSAWGEDGESESRASPHTEQEGDFRKRTLSDATQPDKLLQYNTRLFQIGSQLLPLSFVWDTMRTLLN